MDDGRNASAYMEMASEARERVTELEAALDDAISQIDSERSEGRREIDRLRAILRREWE